MITNHNENSYHQIDYSTSNQNPPTIITQSNFYDLVMYCGQQSVRTAIQLYFIRCLLLWAHVLEEGDGVPQLGDERVDVFLVVVEIEAGPHAARHSELPVQRLRAVVSGSHRDALLVEEEREVGRMHLLGVERDQPRPPARGRRRTVQLQVIDGGQLVVEVLPQLPLVGVYSVHADGGEVVAGGGESDDLGDGRGARLEPGGREGVGGGLQLDGVDHLPSA